MLLSVLVLAAALDPGSQAAAAVQSTELPASHSGVSQAALDAGLKAFKRRRFSAAEVDFQKAVDADPASAGPTSTWATPTTRSPSAPGASSRQEEGEGAVRQGLRDGSGLSSGLGRAQGAEK